MRIPAALFTKLVQMAMRCHDRTRRFWTMLALALRIAQALSLHDSNPPFSVNPLEREMRRRLWHAIRWLDVQAALISASEPMIQPRWLIFKPFYDINDDKPGTNSEKQISSQGNLSETSLFNVIPYAQETARHLTVSNSVTPYTKDRYQRQQLVLTFKQHMNNLFIGLKPERINFHWYLTELAHSIGVFLQLLAVRLTKKGAYLENSQASSVEIFRLAVEALESRLRVYGSTKAQPWQWIQYLFFPWQALIIALVEIPVCHDVSLLKVYGPLLSKVTNHLPPSISSRCLVVSENQCRA